MQTQNYYLTYILYGMIVLCFVVSCNLEPQQQDIIPLRDEYYSFNPDTVLMDISNNKEGVFKPLNATPFIPGSQSFSLVRWTEKDYYLISQFAYQKLWRENPNDWNLRHVYFSLDCSEVLEGPQFAVLVFNNVLPDTNERTSLIEHGFYIDVGNNTVNSVKTEYAPALSSNYPTVVTNANISIREALIIAEEQGGRDSRESVSNDCQIGITLFGNSENWRITYVDPLDLFQINVSIVNGEYKVLKR
jgi:hypothetical protein